jgi:hypothetical protein
MVVRVRVLHTLEWMDPRLGLGKRLGQPGHPGGAGGAAGVGGRGRPRPGQQQRADTFAMLAPRAALRAVRSVMYQLLPRPPALVPLPPPNVVGLGGVGCGGGSSGGGGALGKGQGQGGQRQWLTFIRRASGQGSGQTVGGRACSNEAEVLRVLAEALLQAEQVGAGAGAGGTGGSRSSALRGLRLRVFDGPPRHTLRQTAALFRDTNVLVGVHGGGLANAAFCRPGAVLVEVTLPEPLYNMYVRGRGGHQHGLHCLCSSSRCHGLVSGAGSRPLHHLPFAPTRRHLGQLCLGADLVCTVRTCLCACLCLRRCCRYLHMAAALGLEYRAVAGTPPDSFWKKALPVPVIELGAVMAQI